MGLKEWQQQISKALDLPEDLYNAGPRIIIVGFDTVSIEDFRKIILFEEERLIFEVGSGTVTLTGQDLVLAQIKTDQIEVQGQISGLTFRKEAAPCPKK